MKKIRIGIVVGLALCAVGGPSWVEAEDNVIYACVSNNNGRVRIVSDATDCRPSEVTAKWNILGPTGPVGPQGPPGPESQSAILAFHRAAQESRAITDGPWVSLTTDVTFETVDLTYLELEADGAVFGVSSVSGGPWATCYVRFVVDGEEQGSPVGGNRIMSCPVGGYCSWHASMPAYLSPGSHTVALELGASDSTCEVADWPGQETQLRVFVWRR